MTLEEAPQLEEAGSAGTQGAGAALEELLLSAKKQDNLTVGVYESAKVMNVDPDSVSFCVLATEQYECDIALQIHFTLIQAFCFDNDISIVRVNDTRRLAELLGSEEAGEPADAHCVLITSPAESPSGEPALEQLRSFCAESRRRGDWLPAVALPAR
ncbi:growth arrest and DNA damage-inducible protein GADD45 gamma [Amia ocellicauda]|uniref:growth arrest and DNA damage-inducible protein GADD45 gamma n=1 Tax=Amia ocellicauda TaxID=2972642 RepID=UPI003463FE7E|nr:GA45G protein [Amia calva]